MDVKQAYLRWLREADDSLQEELRAMDDAAREDAFYRDLAFGTGGLRGVIGPGANRMNLHTVRKASQGLADYVRRRYPADDRRIAVSYDSRLLSDAFARAAAGVFAANGIRADIYPWLMPTPCLSYAVPTAARSLRKRPKRSRPKSISWMCSPISVPWILRPDGRRG